MKNKTVLITGGNAGIGKATALALAQKGADVIIACRNPEKGEETAEDIRRLSGNPAVRQLPCDLASFVSVRQAAGQFRSVSDRLDVLINNAGVYTSAFQLTPEGFELQFGVNHLGHFLLTQLLLDPLRAARKARVINVTSAAHYDGRLDLDEVRQQKKTPYRGWVAYARSKLANVLFTREFARRHPAIDCNCLHPGMVSTRFANKHGNWYTSLAWHLMKPFMRTPRQGAKTSIYLASAGELTGVSGEYFDKDQRRRRPSAIARDDELAAALWEKSSKWIAE